MSTMLRSAAMTLLSKTLLTFLYKYLSDVDVEGVEMPSLYGGSNEGGWGVRLSNVKLREGAELMILPGTKKPKEKGKGSSPSTHGVSAASTQDSSNDENDEKGNFVPGIDKAGSSVAINGSVATKPTVNSQSHSQKKAHQNGHAVPLGLAEKKNKKQSTQNSVNTPSTDAAGASIQSDDEMELMELEDNSLASLPDGAGRPETPTQESSMSFLSCFGPSSSQHGTTKQQRMKEQSEQANNMSSQTPLHEETNLSSQTPLPDEHAIRARLSASEPILNVHGLDESEIVEGLRKGIDNQLPDTVFEKSEGEEQQPNDAQIPPNEEKDDEGPSLPTMALRIGEGGYIGTLDVRLVGKELHVLVEDAFLSLEAVRKEEEPIDPNDTADDEDTTTDTLPGDTTEKKPAAATPAPPVDINDLRTTGERVLATNPIARIFSSLPHLFLRDVVVRLVVRTQAESDDDYDDEEPPEVETINDENGEASIEDNADTIVDIGIGLLSVTEHEDLMFSFSNNEEGGDEKPPEQSSSQGAQFERQSSQLGGENNEFLERRIRTGKGADGGIWVNVITPKRDISPRVLSSSALSNTMNQRWARHEWFEATHYRVLQCSGLDIQARIFLGTKKELAQVNSSYLWYTTDDTDTYQGIDHTLYGFDHVAPGPTPSTLPPLQPAPHCAATRSMDEGDDRGVLKSQIYKTDRNGIQCSQMESCFYRVARGLTPTRCRLEHLPCENCLKCWELTDRMAEGSSNKRQYLDSYTPMPGLALSVSFRDPLELNVDRVSLESLGLVISLFKKKEESQADTENEEDADSGFDSAEDEPPVTEIVAEPEPASRGYFASFFFGSSGNDEEANDGHYFSPRRRKSKPLPPAFPKYMVPENIQIIGVFAAELRLRVHVMKETDGPQHNSGLSFCYWDARGTGITLDQQKLTSDPKKFHDLRLDVATLDILEFQGVQRKVLVSAGIPPPQSDGDIVSLASVSSSGRGHRPPWPTTACALLDVPGTLESLVYESRERHGVQLRLLDVCNLPLSGDEKSRTLANCQIGAIEMDVPWPLGAVISEIKSQAMMSLGRKSNTDTKDDKEPAQDESQKDTATQYRVQLGGGRVRLGSMVDVRLPLTRLAGDICPQTGFSMETLLERVELSYGASSNKLFPTVSSDKGATLTLKRFPNLPESVRLRILLFVEDEDLEPLEQALGVKKQANSYLRCNAVNKGLGKLALASRGKKKSSETAAQKKLNRRQELMNKLLTLDDDALESLWTSHQRKQKKGKKASGAKKATGHPPGEPG